jgi:hypothetical protein
MIDETNNVPTVTAVFDNAMVRLPMYCVECSQDRTLCDKTSADYRPLHKRLLMLTEVRLMRNIRPSIGRLMRDFLCHCTGPIAQVYCSTFRFCDS